MRIGNYVCSPARAACWAAVPDGDEYLTQIGDPPTSVQEGLLGGSRVIEGFDHIGTLEEVVVPVEICALERRLVLLATSQELSDRMWDWWDCAPPPLVYRTRTMPAARSIAFHQHTTWTAIEARPFREAQALLATLVVHHGFDVPESWLS